VKGSGLSPQDSSKLRVEVPYKALMVQHKYGTHKVYLANEYVQYKAMQDIREIELRDSESNANNMICFDVRATTLRPLLHIEGFSLYVHTGPFTKGPRNYNTTLGVQYSSLKYNHLYIRGTRHKAKP